MYLFVCFCVCDVSTMHTTKLWSSTKYSFCLRLCRCWQLLDGYAVDWPVVIDFCARPVGTLGVCLCNCVGLVASVACLVGGAPKGQTDTWTFWGLLSCALHSGMSPGFDRDGPYLLWITPGTCWLKG